ARAHRPRQARAAHRDRAGRDVPRAGDGGDDLGLVRRREDLPDSGPRHVLHLEHRGPRLPGHDRRVRVLRDVPRAAQPRRRSRLRPARSAREARVRVRASAAIVVAIAIACFVGPIIAGWLGVVGTTIDTGYGARGPSWSHWFGTDPLGRDMLVRVM